MTTRAVLYARRAVLYARVSGDDGHGRNLDDQLRMCREYAERQGWSVVAELSEDERGVSGNRLDAPKLLEALDMAAKGEYDVLVVREIDRLARDIGKQYIVESELKSCDVKVAYVLGEYPDTPEGELNKAIKAAIAGYERNKISERMVRGRRREAKRGSVLVHGNPPYGYDVIFDEEKQIYTLVINDEQAKVVKLIYQLYAKGDGERPPLAVRGITKRLNELGIKAPRGGKWRYATVRRILISETYVGTWYYGKWRGSYVANDPEYHITVSVPAIIDRILWKKAQDQRKNNHKTADRNRINNYLITKHLRCGECGYSMSGKSSGSLKSATYICYHAYDRGRGVDCTHKVPYSGKYIDELVWEWIMHILLTPDVLEQGRNKYQSKTNELLEPLLRQVEIANKGIDTYEQQLERLLDLYLSGEVDKELLIERKNRLEQMIGELKATRDELKEQLSGLTLTETQIESVKVFIRSVADGVELSADDFATKRQIVDLLDVQGIIGREQDQTLLHLTCKLGAKSIIVNHNTGFPSSSQSR